MVVALALVACGPADGPTLSPTDVEHNASALKSSSVNICHYTGSGNSRILTVDASAVDAHVANHGDHVFAVESCDDGVDNDCDGLTDDDDDECADDPYVGTWNAELVCDGGDVSFSFDAVSQGGDEYLADDASAMFALFGGGGAAFGYNVSGSSNGGCIGDLSDDTIELDQCNGANGFCTGSVSLEE